MPLTVYNKKRDFKKTSEPKGKIKKSTDEAIFVVQKHDASHLHYDFRLEVKGVLKSWAVPKGPSMNPQDKRLAVMVEDHPFNYKDFEGTIPEGSYGAGNVIVWDNGSYYEIHSEEKKTTEANIIAGLNKGHISFILKGKKLKGEFSLIKLKGKQENAWLLIKKNDRYATKSDILLKDRSVLTKKKLVEKKGSNPKTPAKKKTKKATSFEIDLDTIKPMLASLGDQPFNNSNWIFETKHDGYRTLCIISEDVQLISRNNLSFNRLFSPLLPELKKIPHHAILDGEVVVEDKNGRSSFQLLQNYQQKGSGQLKYYVFDILNIEGNDLRKIELIERKELLRLLLKKQRLKNIIFSEHREKNGEKFYDEAVKQGLEGIIAKEKSSLYDSGKRSSQWLKIKIHQQEEAIIAGITEPKGSRKLFGSLLLGTYKGNKLRYIGNCGTGFNETTLKEVYTKLKPYFISSSPFDSHIKSSGAVQWVKPTLVCQVKFSEWTDGGHMRHPVFIGLRIDKEAKNVMETVKKKAAKAKTAEQNNDNFDVKVAEITLHLTNQNKIYFPKEKITKGDIVNYYREISPVILPYLKNRPQSMNRFPNGITGPSFYQKDVDTGKSPDWIKTEKIFSESNKGYVNYLICNNNATLMYMANLGCIEINPWSSQMGSIEYPDWMVIDLDPENIPFKKVVEAALEVKNIMDELETECYCKTSGATGLHIYVPLAAKYNYNLVKTFAELIAQTVFSRLPLTTSIIRSPQKRQKRVYIDFLQNRKGQTLAAPYSARPKPGATVSTPLEWKEVNDKLDPSNYTIKTIFKRLDKHGDIWKPVIGKGANLDMIIKKIYNSKL